MRLFKPKPLILTALILAIISIYPSTIMAQTVAVTGTITDTQTTPYSNGLLTVTFVNSTGQLATFGGNPSFQKSYAIYLDAAGSFTISLPPNSTASPSIQPAGTQWNFSYQSQGGYGAANINVTITGAGSISGTLSNLARITWPYGNIPPPGAAGQGIVFVSSTTLGWGTTGTAGAVTHTAGNLTALHLMLGNGLADSTVDSACVTNGTGALSGCTSISAGSGASTAGATATGGFACVEAASTGWTPTAGQDYQRCDSTAHAFVCSNNGAAESACSPAPSFPVTVGGTVTSGGIPYFSSTVQESSSALLAANALVVGGGAGAAPATGNADFTLPPASHTLTGGAAGILDMSAASNLKIPASAGAVAAGGIKINTSFGNLNVNDGIGDNYYMAVAGTGASISTDCGATNKVVTIVGSTTAPTCTSLTNSFLPASITATAALSGATYVTATNCSSSASPAVCGSAAAGSVAVPTGVTPTLVVNTTAVTANSQILFTPDESLGTKLSVTCNSTIAQVAIEPIVTARTAATSFTIQYNTTITVNPICLSYLIVN